MHNLSSHHPSTVAQPYAALWRRGPRREVGDVPRSHEELVVLLGLRGTGRYLLEETDISIVPGTLVWADSGHKHMLLSADEDFDMWVVVAHPKLWEHSSDKPRDTGSGSRLITARALAELTALAQVLVESPAPERATGLRWWLARARQVWVAATHDPATAWHPAVARAAHVLGANTSLSVPKLAKEVGLGEGQLGRLFRQQTGRTITAFRNDRRLDEIDRAYAEGQALLPAALDAGFGSYSQFFRVFTARRGKSPRAWYRT